MSNTSSFTFDTVFDIFHCIRLFAFLTMSYVCLDQSMQLCFDDVFSQASRVSWNVNWNLYVRERSVSVPMTLSDLEKWDARITVSLSFDQLSLRTCWF